MKSIRHLLLAAAVGVTTAWPLSALANDHGHARASAGASAAAPVAQAAAPVAQAAAGEMTDAEVRKVDRDAGKITLRHGAIKHLDMPPMTMVFTVADAALLDKVKPGDKIRFSATSEGGKFTLTHLQPAN